MTVFDQFTLSIFNYYKPILKRKAYALGIFYISFLQISLLLLLSAFFAAFFTQMRVSILSSGKAWTLFVMASIFIYFKNWMGYSGKKRTILNAKKAKQKVVMYNVWVLWMLPFLCLSLGMLLLNAV